MTKSETVWQLAAASNAARVEAMNQQIESLRRAKLTSTEELATLLATLAALTDETRASLEQIGLYSREQGEQFRVRPDG
jgi:predicted  nucleic acid-binding Zn-ribbon protein